MNIDDFAKSSRFKGWADDGIGFSMDVDAGVMREQTRFALVSAPLSAGEPQVFRLEWTGDGTSLADVQRDFYAAYGHFAEEAQFITRTVRPNEVLFEVLVGTRDHGHRAEFVLVGRRIETVAGRYLELRKANERNRGRE